MEKRKYDRSGMFELIDGKIYSKLIDYIRDNRLTMVKASHDLGICRPALTKILKDKAITSLNVYYKLQDFFKEKEGVQ